MDQKTSYEEFRSLWYNYCDKIAYNKLTYKHLAPELAPLCDWVLWLAYNRNFESRGITSSYILLSIKTRVRDMEIREMKQSKIKQAIQTSCICPPSNLDTSEISSYIELADERYHSMLRMLYIEGKTMEYVGSLTGISRQAVNNKQIIAIKQIKKRIGDVL